MTAKKSVIEATVYCRHYFCRCLRASELLAMHMLQEAIEVHYKQVRCRQVDARQDTGPE